MACRLCKERGKNWEGSDPMCAFENDVFSGENWNCATMNRLREIAEAKGMSFRNDATVGSWGCVDWEASNSNGIIMMTWYKNRGSTGNALVMKDDEAERPLTLRDAEDAIWAYEKPER